MKKKSNGGKGGRPTKYKAEYVAIASQMCRLGATDADLAPGSGGTCSTHSARVIVPWWWKIFSEE
jgi:hypothetical protein